MLRTAIQNCMVASLFMAGCTKDPPPKPGDTGGGTVTPPSDDTGTPPDDTGDPSPDDTGAPVDLCRNLVISPPSVLLDASDGTAVHQPVVLSNDCDMDAAPLEVQSLILADESGAFSMDASPPYTLASGTSVTLNVQYTPSDGQIQAGFVIIISDDPDTPNASIGMVGLPPGDNDGDGFVTDVGGGEDCNDEDASIHPDAEEVWYDGIDTNCDGLSDYDQDGDGYDSVDYEGDDCDDLSDTIHPGIEEVWYDGIDSNCDDLSDYDQDGDGYDSVDYLGTDCNDADPATSPGAAEIWYDSIDTDCSGTSDFDADGDGYDHIEHGGTDCDETDAAVSPGAIEVFDGIDNDCDGFIDEETDEADDDGDGFAEADGDCDDSDPAIFPTAPEACDGIDNNCDLSIDETDSVGCIDWYEDADRDGFGAGEPMCMCESSGTHDSTLGTDCNDLIITVFPGAIESWYDGTDSDCDGLSDYDADLDGHEATFSGGTDCNDLDGTIHPDAVEIPYDAVDSNCDSWSDFDADKDGHDHIDYGGGDCNDEVDTIAPGFVELQDLIDQDCDGFIDEDTIFPGDIVISEVMVTPLFTSEWDGEYFEVHNTTDAPIDLIQWEIFDGGGIFTIDTSVIVPAEGFAVFGVNDDLEFNGGVAIDFTYDWSEINFTHAGDTLSVNMDDTLISSLNYTASWEIEVGKSLSLDMDFTDPESSAYSTVWCPSNSTLPGGDRGTPGGANDPCLESDWDSDGHTELSGDCDDWDPLVNPDATEVCDGIDNDCDELTDEAGAEGSTNWHRDFDEDGYGNPDTAVLLCDAPEGFVADATDCNDMDADKNPGMIEVWYDGIDSDCDELSDFDSDLDSFDSTDHGGMDCDDEDASINPTALDEWYDGIDSDCGGEDDYDMDADGFQSDLYGGLDCADEDPFVSPASPEYWNGTDDNCVGGRDDFMVMGFSTLVVAADTAIHFGHESGISSGDFNGDGTTDLIVAATLGGYYEEGTAYMLDGSTPWTLSGDPLSVSSARFSGSAAGNFMGTLGAHQVDIVGTNKTDLIVAGSDALEGHAMCLIDGEALTGPVSCLDARIRWTGADDDYPRVINHLDMDGDGLVEVIYADSRNAVGDTGKVYAFSGASLIDGDYNLLTDNDWRVDGRHAYDYVGSQLGGGDLDDDGYDELLIGAHGDDHPDPKTGSIFVMAGGSTSPVPIRTAQFDKDAHIYGETADAEVGRWNPSEVADINGDGSTDLVVSSPGTESVHVYYSAGEIMGSSVETTHADLNIEGTDEASYFGVGLSVGDVDNDSYGDILIGAPDEANPGDGDADSEGHVYIFFGGEIIGDALTADFAGAHFYGRASGDNFGALIRSNFDMNNDGLDDIAIGAPGNTLTTPDGGQVHILLMPSGR